jgi:uncharacterized membrane protein YagU involved in acid resistance
MHPRFSKAVIAGFAGTVAMTLMMYLVAPMMGLKMDIAAMLGSLMGGNWTAGMMLHFTNGSIVFPAIYTYILYARLPGSPAARGTLWGIGLWMLAQVVVMPMMGGGLFSSAMGGMMAVMASLAGHIAYGSLLGAIASAPFGQPVAHA